MYYNERNNYEYNKNYYNNDNYEQYNKKNCCVKRVEETFCCFPSYYNEEKTEKKQECWEGTFKIYPKHNDNDYEKCNQTQKENQHHSRNCCFGNWFRNCRW